MQQLTGWDMIQDFNQVLGRKKKENIFVVQTGGLALTYKSRFRLNPGVGVWSLGTKCVASPLLFHLVKCLFERSSHNGIKKKSLYKVRGWGKKIKQLRGAVGLYVQKLHAVVVI